MVNKLTGQKVVLSNDDVDIIKRIQLGKHPNKNEDPYKVDISCFDDNFIQAGDHQLWNCQLQFCLTVIDPYLAKVLVEEECCIYTVI